MVEITGVEPVLFCVFSAVDSHYPKSPLLVSEIGLAPTLMASQTIVRTSYTIRYRY